MIWVDRKSTTIHRLLILLIWEPKQGSGQHTGLRLSVMHMLTDQQLLHANRTSPFAEAEAALRFQTTYKKCFADDVNAAQTANPDYFAGADK